MSPQTHTLSGLQQRAEFALAFRVRQPQPAQPKALLVLLHGVGGAESNLLELAAGVDPDTLVVLPRGPLTLGELEAAIMVVEDELSRVPVPAEHQATVVVPLSFLEALGCDVEGPVKMLSLLR